MHIILSEVKQLRKWLKFILGFILFLTIVPTVSAEENKIESIHIDVELHENGSATIRETRNMRTYEHTEVYIVLENLQDSDLLAFQVENFDRNEQWDIDSSFEEKAYQYGVIETDDGYELAWGISEYGQPEYHLSYRLSNLVRNLEDGQAMLWDFNTFLDFPTDRMTLEISAPFPLEEKVLDFYGFGFEGPIDINNGVLEWTGYGLDDSDSVIVMLQFPENTFQATVSVDETLEEQKERATSGSSYNEDGPMPLWAKILLSVVGFLVGIPLIGGIALGIQHSRIKKEHNHYRPYQILKEQKDKKTSQPPMLAGDIGKYSYLLKRSVFGGADFSQYFFAYILIWSLEDKIQVETREVDRRFFGPKTEADMYIQNFEEEVEMNELSFDEYVALFEMGESTLEEVIWSLLLESASATGLVTGEAIEEWSKEEASTVMELVTKMDLVSREWLEENGYMELTKVPAKPFNVTVERLTEKGEAVVTNTIQFDNFLKDIKEAELTEYDNWAELIVWAALFNKAEKTIEYLEEFEPATWGHLVNTYPYVYGNYYGYQYFYTSSSTGLASGGYGGSSGGGVSSSGGGGGAGGGGGGGSR